MPIKSLAIWILSAFSCAAGTYNVGSGQTYATIMAAYAQLLTDNPGAWSTSNTIHVFSGTYTEQLNYYACGAGTTASFRLILQLDSGAVIDEQSTRAYGIDSCINHTTVQGSGEIKGSTSELYYAEGGASDVIIAGSCDPRQGGCTTLRLHNAGGNCFNFAGNTGVLIYNTYFYSCASSDITVSGTGPCSLYNLKTYSAGAAAGVSVYINGCTVHDVDTENNAVGGVTFVGAPVTSGTAYNILSVNNRYGLQCNTSASGVTFYNSLDIGSFTGANFDNSTVCTYENNTFVSETNAAMEGGPDARNNKLLNNAIYVSVSGAYGLAMTANNLGGGSDYNDIYVVPASGGVLGICGVTATATLALWQAACGTDAHSISANPAFTNPAGTTAVSFQFPTSSPLYNAGTTIGAFSTDYFGTSRPQSIAWDIGFFEALVTNCGCVAMTGIQ